MRDIRRLPSIGNQQSFSSFSFHKCTEKNMVRYCTLLSMQKNNNLWHIFEGCADLPKQTYNVDQ